MASGRVVHLPLPHTKQPIGGATGHASCPTVGDGVGGGVLGVGAGEGGAVIGFGVTNIGFGVGNGVGRTG
jgi:hypothetical protein